MDALPNLALRTRMQHPYPLSPALRFFSFSAKFTQKDPKGFWKPFGSKNFVSL
jgi:hypothetical protein